MNDDVDKFIIIVYVIIKYFLGGFTMGNFNEEMVRELADLNLGSRLVLVSENDKGTLEDYAKLEANIFARTEENRIMMEQSIINAKYGLSVEKMLNEKLLVKKL